MSLDREPQTAAPLCAGIPPGAELAPGLPLPPAGDEKRSVVERLLAEAKKDLALAMAWTTPQ